MNSTFTKKQFAMAAAGLLLSSVASTAFAAPTSQANSLPGTVSEHKTMHHGGAGHHGHHRCGFMKELNLTTKQKEQLKAVHKRFREENKPTFEALRAKQEKLKAMGDDPAKAEEKQALRKEVRAEHHSLSEKHHQMMDGILTPEQVQQMKSIKAKCRAEHHGPGSMGEGSHHHHGPDDKATTVPSKK